MEPLFPHLALPLGGGIVGVEQSVPLDDDLPLVGGLQKFRHRSRVVLPLPEEPMMARAWPCSRSKLMSSSTRVAPKCFSI